MPEVNAAEEIRSLEAIPQPLPKGEVAINQEKIDAVIRFAEQSEKFGKALDTIRRFVLGRAYPGDFVLFGDKVSVTGPGAERMMSALALMGVSVTFTRFHSTKSEGEDKNGKWLTWFYDADVDIGCLHMEGVEGRCSSRDLFFGFAKGQWKDLSDVKEHDIRMVARRGVIKEGIVIALGMRSLPNDPEFLKSIGLDPAKIKTVEFGSEKKGTSVTGAQDEFVAVVLDVTIKRTKEADKDGKGGYVIYAVKFNNNVTAETFDAKVAEKAKSLKGQKAFARTAAAKQAKYAPTLVEIRTATAEDEKKPDVDAAGDAQDPY